ncbi:MAG: radical SAM protein [Bacillota bacterium]
MKLMDNSQIKTILIDGYLDEPSCLGVPPYISPHIRYTYGALVEAGIRKKNLSYKTVDQLREDWENNLEWLEQFDLLIIIAGTTVPGNYLGGRPISMAELRELGQQVYYPQKVLGGPITLIKNEIQGFDYLCGELAALDLYQLLTGEPSTYAHNHHSSNHPVSWLNNWAICGATVTKKHPNYPHLVCELETFRGCSRTSHCAFCSERLKATTYQRPTADIIAEVEALAQSGNHYFRLGCQTDILSYQAHRGAGQLRPNPEAIRQLYRGIHRVDPRLEVLHLDNMNPATLLRHRKQGQNILKTIVNYNTPGDVAAFGLESADPVVLEKNNIESNPDIVLQAIELLNQIGGGRKQGIPKLLPGLNFLHGLIGERPETLDHNYRCLKQILDKGLMVRRINIRKVVTLGNYPGVDIDEGAFRDYKQKINEDINRPMLRRVFPPGTILQGLLTEQQKGHLTYARQLGTYPILVGIPAQLASDQFVSARVIDYGYRSLTAIPWPFRLEEATPEQLTFFPGIGNKRARQIFFKQPRSREELRQIVGDRFYLDWFF